MKDKTAISIGKSIIRRFFDFYENSCLDDRTEFFPILKVIIWGIVGSCKNNSQKLSIEKELKEYAALVKNFV